MCVPGRAIMKPVNGNINSSRRPNFLPSPVNEGNPEKWLGESGWKFKTSKVNVCLCFCARLVWWRLCACLHFQARRVFCVETPHATRACRSCAPAAAARSAAGCFPLEQVRKKVRLFYQNKAFPVCNCDFSSPELLSFVILPLLIQQFVIKKKKKIEENPNLLPTESDSWLLRSYEIKQHLMWEWRGR